MNPGSTSPTPSPPPPTLRAGSVPYLNVAPLVPGLEGRLRLLPPSQLAVALRQGELDAGLLSITEALFHPDYDILDGPCVASDGEVLSVFLAHRLPVDRVTRVWCDTASLASVNLLRVLLAERGHRPDFVPLVEPVGAPDQDFLMLIGDPALRFRTQAAAQGYALLDLGAAWRALTSLPFVFAAWVLRRDAETRELRAELQAAAARGQADPDAVIQRAAGFDAAFRRRYLTEHVRSVLGPREKEGLARFVELLRQHGDRPVFDPCFVR